MSSSSIYRLLPVITVFFFWGFVAAGNDILIPVFKESLMLEQWQSQMIAFAFYVAYTVGSLLYMFYASWSGVDLVSKIGYKNGLMLGLFISAFGTLMFIPAAWYNSFGLMLSGLFIVGLGFSLQQIVANPLTIALGSPETGSQRLSMAGGINNIGTTIGPVILGYALFGSQADAIKSTIADIEMVKIPYLILGCAFVAMAIIIKFSAIPQHIQNDESTHRNSEQPSQNSALHFPQLTWGMLAIFVYVGVEVATASNLPELMRQELGMNTAQMAPYISLYWASLMIGRWTAASDNFSPNKHMRRLLRLILPYAAFGLFLLINATAGHPVEQLFIYVLPIMVLIAADFYCMGNPTKQLLVFSFLGIFSLLVAMFTNGLVSIFAIISVGLFCSTLWPCIFNIAITGLNRFVNQGSSFLIMMIMGGGIISLLQGKLADDALLGIKHSYWVGVSCFGYLAYYAYRFRNLAKLAEISE
jgi:FHS family L-fucose permease-like MFS transporter